MANVGPSSACQFSGRTHSSRSQQHGRCRATTLAVPHGLGIQFNLPYRVSFGQSLSIVGSSEYLGNWDVERRIPMQWSDGDVWQAEVQASHDLEALEYKYIVVEHDGNISCWKPGENVRLTLPRVKASSIEVRDAWDGSIHEVLPQLSPEVEPDPTPVTSTARPTMPPPSEASSVMGQDVDMAVENALQRTYSELENTLRLSLQLVDDAADPSDPRLLMNDQKLAAVTRRAISLSQALEAGAPPPAYILKSIEDDKLQQ